LLAYERDTVYPRIYEHFGGAYFLLPEERGNKFLWNVDKYLQDYLRWNNVSKLKYCISLIYSVLNFIKNFIYSPLFLLWSNKRRLMTSPCCLCLCIPLLNILGLTDCLRVCLCIPYNFCGFLWGQCYINGKHASSSSENFLSFVICFQTFNLCHI
jgi:hypothetical protein